MNNSISPYLWMLSGSVALATMGTLTHALGSRCEWQVVALARTSLALVFAVGLTHAAGARFVVLRPPTMWVRSIAGSVSLVCTFYALPRMPVADVFTITSVFPLWVALLSWPLLGKAPSGGVWLAIVVGITGVVLVEQPHLAAADHPAAAAPAIAALIASFTTAIAMLGIHRLQGIVPRAIVAHFSAAALVVVTVLLMLPADEGHFASRFDPATTAMLFGVGVCATTGQLLLTKAFASGPPAKVSVVALSQVVFAMGYDLLVWQYPFRPITAVGILLVLAPTAWLLLRQPRAARGGV